ncbi:PREDICTED: uncharacterized protein LOC105153702 [Acromyrmex echinatior]|uniref:uncharacterized protein LOC105153702 n=1 Tax=Acromyrmex echinatior TaxID=103372 RepID=UPI000580C88F|nr:PREDICTED: uncharacterized protein LOC105153702 [Acromyrmex echinatior]
MSRHVRNSWKEGEGYSLFDSRSFIIYIAIYAGAISLAILACTNGKKCTSLKTATHRTKPRTAVTSWSEVRLLSRRYNLTTTGYKFLEIEINVGPPSYVRSPWKIITDINCRCLSISVSVCMPNVHTSRFFVYTHDDDRNDATTYI